MALSQAGRRRKGADAEREVVQFLRDHLGDHIVRTRAGAGDDRGDLAGLPDMVVQVKSYVDIARALRVGLADALVQKENAGVPWGCAFLRRRGGQYVVCMSAEDFVSLYREATLREGR